jgi:hypothetical protein
MKIALKFFALVSLLFAGLTLSQAQPGGGGRNFDPEKRAEQQTTMMTDSLSLSDAQANKVGEINRKYAKQWQDARNQNADGDWEAMRSKMMTMREEQDKELQAVLTTEQWEKWLKVREAQRANWGVRRRGAGKGKPDKQK